LNEIFETQIPPNDKSGLGYKKEATHVEAISSKKHEVKDEENVASQPFTKGKESFKRTKQERHQEATFTPQRKWTPKKRYESDFHGQCYSCNEYGHKDLECRSYARIDNGRYS
jgi:hypothetical protein